MNLFSSPWILQSCSFVMTCSLAKQAHGSAAALDDMIKEEAQLSVIPDMLVSTGCFSIPCLFTC